MFSRTASEGHTRSMGYTIEIMDVEDCLSVPGRNPEVGYPLPLKVSRWGVSSVGTARTKCNVITVVVLTLLILHFIFQTTIMITSASSRVVFSFGGFVAAFIVIVIFIFRPQRFPLPSSLSRLQGEQQIPSQPQWLIATMCAAQSQARRNIIRQTWQTLYRNPQYTTRFVLSGYDDIWDPLIQKENETHGDIITLKNLDPRPSMATMIKPEELFKYLVTSGEKYAWVSKLDDDAFLLADTFNTEFLSSITTTSSTSTTLKNNNPSTLIAVKTRNPTYSEFDWPGGAFYTLSWPLIEQIVTIHESPAGQADITTPEDVRIGKYLYDAKVDFDYIDLQNERNETLIEIPVSGARLPHKITKRAIVVHFLKSDETYLRVAGLFGKRGYNGGSLEDWTEGEGVDAEGPI